MNDKRKRSLGDDGELFEDDLVIFEEDVIERQPSRKVKRDAQPEQAEPQQKRYKLDDEDKYLRTRREDKRYARDKDDDDDDDDDERYSKRRRKKKSLLKRVIEEIIDLLD